MEHAEHTKEDGRRSTRISSFSVCAACLPWSEDLSNDSCRGPAASLETIVSVCGSSLPGNQRVGRVASESSGRYPTWMTEKTSNRRRTDAATIAAPRRRPRRPGICVGIDLAGVEYRETGVAILRGGRLDLLTRAGDDAEVLALARSAGRWGTVAINAPLTRPFGRCCLDDDCRCRTDPGTRSRQLERELAHMGIPTLATALIKVLARRGGGSPPRSPSWATSRWRSTRSPRSGCSACPGAARRRRTADVASIAPSSPWYPGSITREPRSTSSTRSSALTALLWRQGGTRTVGRPEEGLMVIPDAEGLRIGQR